MKTLPIFILSNYLLHFAFLRLGMKKSFLREAQFVQLDWILVECRVIRVQKVFLRYFCCYTLFFFPPFPLHPLQTMPQLSLPMDLRVCGELALIY